MQNNYINSNYFQLFKQINMLNNANIGIYGGSFNPPHLGHLYIAKKAIVHCNLQLLIWLITPKNPLKINNNDSYLLNHNQKLSKNLTKNNFNIKVSTFENSFNSYYTFNTLKIIYNVAKLNNNKLFWVMGNDNWVNFNKFYNWHKFLLLTNIIIFAREKFSFNALHNKANILYCNNITNNITNCFKEFNNANKIMFHLIPKNSLSSTNIRNYTSKD